MRKHCKSWIYLLLAASAISFTLRLAALWAKSFAIIRAKQSHRKAQHQLLAKRLIHVKLMSVKNNVLVT